MKYQLRIVACTMDLQTISGPDNSDPCTYCIIPYNTIINLTVVIFSQPNYYLVAIHTILGNRKEVVRKPPVILRSQVEKR